jgi:hypothetical protein
MFKFRNPVSGFTAGSLFVVMAILMVIAVISRVLITDDIQPRSMFARLLISVFITGALASILIEFMGIRLLGPGIQKPFVNSPG